MKAEIQNVFRLLDLPPELLMRILKYADLPSLRVCRGVPGLHFITNDSSILYRMARLAAFVEENPLNTQVGIPQRLDMLRRRTSSFNTVLPDFIYPLAVNFPTSWIYAMSDGIYLAVESPPKAWRYIRLPSENPQNIVWTRFEIPQFILDVALAVIESDLLVAVTSTKQLKFNFADDALIELRCFQFSTGAPHPQAQNFCLDVQETHWGHPGVYLEVVGDLVLLLITYHAYQWEPDRLYLYDWKRGYLRMELQALARTYSSAIFLSPSVVMLTRQDGAFELWKIPDSLPQTANKPSLTLKLPKLQYGGQYNIGCGTAPNTACGASSRAGPFHSSSANSIVVFHVRTEILGEESRLLLVIPRQELLSQLSRFSSLGTREAPWTEWGSDGDSHCKCRWVLADEYNLNLIQMSCGQRCVMIADDDGASQPLVIYDFNPYTYERTERQADTDRIGRLKGESNGQFLTQDIFQEPVGSRLGYVSIESSTRHDYKGLVMDEEWLLGVHENQQGDISSLDIWHMG